MTGRGLSFHSQLAEGDVAMQAPGWLRRNVVLGLLSLVCVLLDVGALVALGGAVRRLIGGTSPFALFAIAGAAIVAVRILLSVRLAESSGLYQELESSADGCARIPQRSRA